MLNRATRLRSSCERLLLVVLSLGLIAAASGCGNSDDDVQKAVDQALQEQNERERERELAAEQKRLKRELRKLKRDRSSGGSSGGNSAGAATISCGSGVTVNSVTTCPFANNVADEVRANGTGFVYAYSPALGKDIRMDCTGSATITCRGGNNAVVRIR